MCVTGITIVFKYLNELWIFCTSIDSTAFSPLYTYIAVILNYMLHVEFHLYFDVSSFTL